MNNLARLLRVALVGMLALTAVGCASIVHSGNRPVMIDSNPEGAQVSISDRRFRIAYTQTTPCTAMLNPHGGYFRGQTYTVTFELPGYATAQTTIYPKLSPWYFGNIVFGGIIGFVVCDPLTGSMWNLRPLNIQQDLVKLPAPTPAAPPPPPSVNTPPPVSAPVAPAEVVTPAVRAPSSSDETNAPAPVTLPTSDNTNSPAQTPTTPPSTP